MTRELADVRRPRRSTRNRPEEDLLTEREERRCSSAIEKRWTTEGANPREANRSLARRSNAIPLAVRSSSSSSHRSCGQNTNREETSTIFSLCSSFSLRSVSSSMAESIERPARVSTGHSARRHRTTEERRSSLWSMSGWVGWEAVRTADRPNVQLHSRDRPSRRIACR